MYTLKKWEKQIPFCPNLFTSTLPHCSHPDMLDYNSSFSRTLPGNVRGCSQRHLKVTTIREVGRTYRMGMDIDWITRESCVLNKSICQQHDNNFLKLQLLFSNSFQKQLHIKGIRLGVPAEGRNTIGKMPILLLHFKENFILLSSRVPLLFVLVLNSAALTMYTQRTDDDMEHQWKRVQITWESAGERDVV